jgi:hypothetical protein
MIGRPPRPLVVLYMAGAGLGLAWLMLGYAGLALVTRRSSEPSSDATALYRGLPCRGPRPRLRVSARLRRPVLVGLFRQTILVPAELDLPETVEQLRLSLLHELAHAERMDSWFGLASSLSQATWFFIPPLWWIRSQMRLDQEFIADRVAADALGPRPSYASSLVDIACPAAPQRASRASGALSPQGGGSALFLRVLMLVQCPFAVESRVPRWWGWSSSALMLAGALGASCLTARIPADSPPTPWHSTSGMLGRSFQMRRLVVRPTSPISRQPSSMFELPIALPELFDLSVDVWGDPRSLVATRVVGRALNHPAVAALSPAEEQWHCVRIRRDRYGLTIWIDQHRLPRSRDAETTSWLSVEPPPGQTGHFRNLHLVW